MKLVKCDMCGSTAEEETDALFWLRLQRVGHLRRAEDPEEWHVCSWRCLIDLGEKHREAYLDEGLYGTTK